MGVNIKCMAICMCKMVTVGSYMCMCSYIKFIVCLCACVGVFVVSSIQMCVILERNQSSLSIITSGIINDKDR